MPKGDGTKTRPIGIPSFEDKVLQRAVAMVLEAVFEQDFLTCSYGYRPGRSAHMALGKLWQGLMEMGGGWVLEVDIQSFFDSLDHHYWARSRRGRWVVQRKTAGSRFRRAVKRIHQWLRTNRHQPVAWQHQQLVAKLRGHNNYFGIIGNFRALSRLRLETKRAWRKWLDRRSDKARMSWQRFGNLLRRYPLPAPVIRYRVWDLAAKPCR